MQAASNALHGVVLIEINAFSSSVTKANAVLRLNEFERGARVPMKHAFMIHTHLGIFTSDLFMIHDSSPFEYVTYSTLHYCIIVKRCLSTQG